MSDTAARLWHLRPHQPRPARDERGALRDQAGVMLFAALYCGELDGGVDGDRVWMTCTCGAAINR